MTAVIIIESLRHYSEQDIVDMQSLLGELSNRFAQASIDTDLIDTIISSKSHELLVAKIGDRIVGMATVSLTMGPGAGAKVYLEDFIISSTARGGGIGTALWDAVVSWSADHHAGIFFTSGPKHEAAHRFYLHKGAVKRDTTVFKYSNRQP